MEATLLLCAALFTAAPGETGLASSANFIVYAPNQDLAESYRHELAQSWLGEKLAEGEGPVIVHVKISHQHDHAAMLPLEKHRRTHHMIWLDTSTEMAQGATLAHELLHCVLATKFGPALPVFAHEGCASEQDDAGVLAVRERKLRQMAANQSWPSLSSVLDAPHFAATDQTKYTVACSLAEFLFTLGSRAEFLKFAVDGAGGNWDQAARQHYGFANLSDMESRWRGWVVQQMRVAGNREPVRRY